MRWLPFCVSMGLVAAAGGAAGCLPPGPAPGDSEVPGPDDRFFDDDPCPAVGAGLALEETAPFTAGGTPTSLVVLMGGSTEVDDAAIRFAEAAGGGDVLVLRATGSTSSYTTWFAAELPLAAPPAAVGTVRIDDAGHGADDSVLCRVARADALWLAGGDQSDYLVRWPTALHEAIARAVSRGAAIGGTSAGAMSLSGLTFDARYGSVDSAEALAAPLAEAMSITPSPFFPSGLGGSLVDTHFSERGRLGRLVAFLARAGHDGNAAFGLGIDEETAVVIDGERVSVSGAGEAWLVALDDAAVLSAQAGLDAAAHTAPLSLQDRWPPQTGAAAPGAAAFAVVDGVEP